ncbi:MAG: hypothetical protein ABJA02_14020 [Acidobacteriota bacterium]
MRYASRDGQIIRLGIGIMGATLICSLLLFVLNSDISRSFPYFFMIPWLIALLIVLLIPSAVLWYQGKWSLVNPLLFATFSYFIPAFVLGGVMLATGLSQPYFLVYIQDADVNLPYTIQLIMLGYAGLAIGYFLPFGRMAGAVAAQFYRETTYQDSSYIIPSLVLMSLGIINTAISLLSGLFGYQRGAIGIYDGIIFLSTLYWMQASFMLWFIIFRQRKLDNRALVIIGILVVSALTKALFAGNRSSFLQIFIYILIAYLLAGREVRVKQIALAGLMLIAALLVGTVYGTIFRDIKGSEDQQSGGAYTENVFNTIDKIGSDDNAPLLGTGFSALAERIDTLSSVAVVVSNYEQLAPYEASYGLDDNITKDLLTFLVPRVIWPDKPLASEPRKYSELYFNYGDNSFAITPIGDLIRNFGVPGVFFGMLILGLILRGLFRWLVEDQPRVLWRSTLYYMLLTGVSYESFYGSIIPFLVKVGFTVIVGLVLVNMIAKRTGGIKVPVS